MFFHTPFNIWFSTWLLEQINRSFTKSCPKVRLIGSHTLTPPPEMMYVQKAETEQYITQVNLCAGKVYPEEGDEVVLDLAKKKKLSKRYSIKLFYWACDLQLDHRSASRWTALELIHDAWRWTSLPMTEQCTVYEVVIKLIYLSPSHHLFVSLIHLQFH